MAIAVGTEQTSVGAIDHLELDGERILRLGHLSRRRGRVRLDAELAGAQFPQDHRSGT
jgi:hypothetical protein